MTLKNLKNPLKKHMKNPEKSLWIFSGHPAFGVLLQASYYINMHLGVSVVKNKFQKIYICRTILGDCFRFLIHIYPI